jgi:ABC-type antimicrobial peptide transport system permease subunit
MSWSDVLVLAARGVVRRFGRSFLTVMGVGLAAALLTALLTISTTAETRVLGELAKGGPLAGIRVSAAAPGPGAVDTDEPRPGAPRDLDDAAVREIARLPDVVSVVPVLTSRALTVPADPEVEPFVETVVGVELRRASNLPISLLEGRLPGPGALAEVAVTEGYLERLDVPVTRMGRVISVPPGSSPSWERTPSGDGGPEL